MVATGLVWVSSGLISDPSGSTCGLEIFGILFSYSVGSENLLCFLSINFLSGRKDKEDFLNFRLPVKRQKGPLLDAWNSTEEGAKEIMVKADH